MVKRTKIKRARYKKIFKRQKKIAKGRYGSGFFLTNVKKSSATIYRTKK